ncbi:transposase [Capnocytophaga canis]|uniref:transposase n=1 Tax=Capnocytophaga canis TaxID=1848903 RepID=UPI001BB3A8C9|nr:transposase [Capnocytophaga canis]
MEKYNPEIHKRRSVRLKDFDYSREGLYFITICCQNRAHFFGEIVNEKMVLNEIGQIVYTEWINTKKVRANVKLHTFVVMPNHFHAIVEIVHQCRGVLHTPNNVTLHTPNGGKINDNNMEKGVCNTPLQSPSQTLGAIVRGYKSAVSKKIGFSVWQRNYHEHIIRNEASYFKIHEYIENNPAKWEEDRFYS